MLRTLAADASDNVGLEWITKVGRVSGQCACRLGVWAAAGGGPVEFTVTAWHMSPEEMLGALYGKFLLETAMKLESEG